MSAGGARPGAGRPEFAPTDTQRETVKAMAAYGIPQFDIAKVIGCSPPTLRLHFFQELEIAAAEANAAVAQSLFNNATKHNNVAAQIFWMKCRAGWRDVSVDEPGKKDLAREAAATAGAGTGWGDLLLPRPASLN